VKSGGIIIFASLSTTYEVSNIFVAVLVMTKLVTPQIADKNQVYVEFA
jgi:hypothetical protein